MEIPRAISQVFQEVVILDGFRVLAPRYFSSPGADDLSSSFIQFLEASTRGRAENASEIAVAKP